MPRILKLCQKTKVPNAMKSSLGGLGQDLSDRRRLSGISTLRLATQLIEVGVDRVCKGGGGTNPM